MNKESGEKKTVTETNPLLLHIKKISGNAEDDDDDEEGETGLQISPSLKSQKFRSDQRLALKADLIKNGRSEGKIIDYKKISHDGRKSEPNLYSDTPDASKSIKSVSLIIPEKHSIKDDSDINKVSSKSNNFQYKDQKEITKDIDLLINCVLFDKNTKELILTGKEITSVRTDEVVIKVTYSGICGTDLHILEGNFDCSEQPFILGHEIVGYVYCIGNGVYSFKEGDRVVINPVGECVNCSCSSDSDALRNYGVGVHADGGWATYCKVHEKQVIKLRKSITFEQATLLEPLAHVANVWKYIDQSTLNARILILGAGIIGCLLIASLHAKCFQKVFIVEASTSRRSYIAELKTGYKTYTVQEINSKTEERKNWRFDLIIDTVGNASIIEQAVSWLKRKGKFIILGVSQLSEFTIISPFELYSKELQIIGCLSDTTTFKYAMDWALVLGRRYIDLKKLGVGIFSLDHYEEALKSLRIGSHVKAIFNFKENF